MKKLIVIFFSILNLYCNDNLIAEKQNILYIQNLIQVEENIAKMFEKYLLTEFKIPNLNDLKTTGYLGTNFSAKNIMGSDLNFENPSELKLKYSIAKVEYNNKNYLIDLYNRDLYRNNTSVYFDATTMTNSYIEILLKSDEAKTIFNILKSGKSIAKDCNSTNLVNTFCNKNAKTLRWYDANDAWIEYDKKEYNKGNVVLSGDFMLNNVLLNDLSVGSYIIIKDTGKYIKLVNSSSGNLQILKAE